jgi:acetyltransferase-like isoleucine patch superfamily enzyme
MRRLVRIATHLLLALLPSALKVPIYRRCFGYQIGPGVRIGCSPLIGVRRCRIGEGTRIGPLNLFYEVEELELGPHVQVGFLNIVRGGRLVRLGAYSTLMRQNTLNSILDRDFVDEVDATFDLGRGSVVTSGHWLDFSAGIALGDHVIVGGRNSSFWTHNRQRGRAIVVGPHTYLGSEVRVAPGAEVPSCSIVALGSVLSGAYDTDRSLIGGNPAEVQRPLRDRDWFLVLRKTRKDIPDELAWADLPADLRALAAEVEYGSTPAPVPPTGPAGPDRPEATRSCAASPGSLT